MLIHNPCPPGGLSVDHCGSRLRVELLVSEVMAGAVTPSLTPDLGLDPAALLAWLTDGDAASLAAQPILEPLGSCCLLFFCFYQTRKYHPCLKMCLSMLCICLCLSYLPVCLLVVFSVVPLVVPSCFRYRVGHMSLNIVLRVKNQRSRVNTVYN